MSLGTAKAKYQGFSKHDISADRDAAVPQEVDETAKGPQRTIFADGSSVASLNINSRLKEGLQLQGFKTLTTVQERSYGPVTSESCNSDVLIKASTGSGKTIAYMLPLLERILAFTLKNRIGRDHGTIAIVMVPTRELAEQCYDVLQRTLRKIPFIVSGCVTGGEQRKKEKARLRQGVHFLVATVGRLLDHLNTTESFNITNLKYLIFDEADRMLDMGYEGDITKMKNIIDGRGIALEKSILVSATLGEAIKKLSHYVLKNPTVVTDNARAAADGDGDGQAAGEEDASEDELDDEHLVLPPSLTQHVLKVPTKLRLVVLMTFLRWKLTESTSATPVDELVDTGLPSSVPGRANIAWIDDNRKRKKETEEEERKKEGGIKIIVFMSSADSVEYHYKLVSMLKVRSADRHALQRDRQTSQAEIAQRRKEAKKKKGVQKKMESQANAHLDFDDEDGYIEFSSQSGGEGGGEAEDDVAYDSEAEPVPDAEDERLFTPFISTNLFKLHANMSQIDRLSIYEAFRRCANGILFATDVAARGLDMPGVRYVIQYDPALDLKAYTHRIGRTARAGKVGDSVLFVQPPSEEPYVSYLTKETQWNLRTMTPELVLFQLSKYLKGSHLLECASELQGYAERATEKDYELRRLAAVAYQAYLRAYSTYPKELASVFNAKNLVWMRRSRAMRLDKKYTTSEAHCKTCHIATTTQQHHHQHSTLATSRSPSPS